MDKPPTIVDVLETLGSRPKEEIAKDEHTRDVVLMTDADKIEKAYAFKMSGVPVRSIAKSFAVSTSTVYNWLNQHSQNFRERLEQRTKADIISEHLQWLENLEETCLYEASHLESGGDDVTIDDVTGEVKKNRVNKKLLKLRYLNAARSMRMAQIDLMRDTGVLPKAPEHIYHTLDDEKRTVDDKGHIVGERITDDQIKENIIELLATKRALS